MKKHRCYIIDDEPLAIDVIKQHISELEDFEIVGSTTNPVNGFTELQSKEVDLLFLDIRMPELSGLELIEALSKKPKIVITTAFREFALDGFELNVLDYLVKPIALPRFLKTIEKYLETKTSEVHQQQKFIYVQSDRKKIKVELDEILYLEGVKDYVKIVTASQKLLTKSSVGTFLKSLPSNQFVRVHKSYVVNLSHITAYTNHDVEIGDIEIPIGRSYRESFLEKVG